MKSNGIESGSNGHLSEGQWNLNQIVAELRSARTRSRQDCIDQGEREMPSREALRGIIDGFFGVLFPDQFGLPDLTEEGIDYFVGHELDATLRALAIQIQRELQFSCTATDDHTVKHANTALRITREFAARL